MTAPTTAVFPFLRGTRISLPGFPPLSPSERAGAREVSKIFRAWGLRRVVRIKDLDGRHGSYIVLIKIPAARISVGALGAIRFPSGLYGYVGSAAGLSVTLAHRLARHWRRDKARRWHIDYVTSHPGVSLVAAYVSVGSRLPEARMAQLCAQRFPVVPRFGNSDLRGRTPGHLFLLQPECYPAGVLSLYLKASILRGR